MGRIAKQKRLMIEQSNKRILGESMVDIDKVLEDMKYKFGFGDLSWGQVEEFEDHMGGDLINQLSTNEYSDLFSDWMMSKSIGSDYENYGTDDESRYNDNNEDYED
jgi:hypothetical protein